MSLTRTITTPLLEIGYEESGPPDGPVVILLHGFPDDPRTWDGAVPDLAADGCRVLVPWLRGYGPTRFLDAATPAVRPAGGAGRRSAGVHGRAGDRAGDAGRL